MILSGTSRIAGVMGWPVSHSLSPRVHGYWLRHYNTDGAYIPMPVAPEKFEAAVRGLPLLGMSGANVTVPHKETAFRTVDEVDELARRLGAVNTIVVADDGKLLGCNTDGHGFLESLRAADTGWSASAGLVVVLGAGGAARAIVAALLGAGVREVRLLNRTRERAEQVASEFADLTKGGIEVVSWVERGKALDGAALLVNTTTLGMDSNPDLLLPLDDLPLSAAVMDIVYKPLETGLLAAARERGNPAIDGLGMLLHQARPGFAAWFGTDPQVTDDLRRFVLDGTGDASR